MSSDSGIDRRQFITMGAGAMMLLMGAQEIQAQEPKTDGAAVPAGPPVGCAVIGLGIQGRVLLQALARDPKAPILGVCDTYAAAHKRAMDIATKATAVEDYRKILDMKDVEAVFVATPTHQHKQIVLDAIAAGKHVYCEAPIAHTVEDAKAIAQAGKASKKVFQAALVQRADPIGQQVIKFVDADAMGKIVQARGQWHKRGSWRRVAPNAARERELNWRLRKETSTGLVGEVGVHQIDQVSWYLKATPISATGFGSILAWPDGREVADTVQCVVEYPGGVSLVYDATLANSFDRAYEVFFGTESAILIRDGRAWMMKEADSTALGWEVYARKEKIGEETGIALIADATKQLELGLKPGETKAEAVGEQTAHNNCVSAFLNSIRQNEPPAAGAVEAYQSTVTAIKVNEAVVNGGKVTFQKEWFDIA